MGPLFSFVPLLNSYKALYLNRYSVIICKNCYNFVIDNLFLIGYNLFVKIVIQLQIDFGENTIL